MNGLNVLHSRLQNNSTQLDYLTAGIYIPVHQHQAKERMGVIAHQTDLLKL